jgi:protein O-GlcNAc transferase
MTAFDDLGGGLASAAAHLSAQRYGEARAVCDRLAAAYPDHPEVLHVRGLVLFRQGETEAGIEQLGRSLELRPDSADVLANLGAMQEELGNDEAALGCFAAALELAPGDALLRYRVGRAQARVGDNAGAEASYRAVLAALPDFADGLFDLGVVLRAQGRLDEALAAFRRTTEIKPDHAAAWNSLAQTCSDAGLAAEATRAAGHAVALRPEDRVLGSNLICLQPLDPAVTPEEMAATRRQWAARFADPLTHRAKPPASDRNPRRRLRIAYVAADTCRYHTSAMVTLPIIEAHDRRSFEVYCYSDTPPGRADSVTERFRRAATLIETARLDDEALAARIRADNIDIVIDPFGHPSGSRLGAIARRPAPIQVCFPATGSHWMAAIDYTIGDPVVTPPSMRRQFRERVVCPPVGHVYRPLCDVPASSAVGPYERTGRLTFGSFARTSRLNDMVVSTWTDILRAVPAARLVLKPGQAAGEALLLRRRFLERGADPGQIEFVGWHETPAQHLAAYNDVDIVLDPFPYGGITISCEALTMGVPIVTLEADRVFGRYTAAFLKTLGYRELVCSDIAGYVRSAVMLANDHARRSALRRSLSAEFRTSRLCDAPWMARCLERLFRSMWRRWCEQSTR